MYQKPFVKIIEIVPVGMVCGSGEYTVSGESPKNRKMYMYQKPSIETIALEAVSTLCQSGYNRGEFDVTGNDPIIEPAE